METANAFGPTWSKSTMKSQLNLETSEDSWQASAGQWDSMEMRLIWARLTPLLTRSLAYFSMWLSTGQGLQEYPDFCCAPLSNRRSVVSVKQSTLCWKKLWRAWTRLQRKESGGDISLLQSSEETKHGIGIYCNTRAGGKLQTFALGAKQTQEWPTVTTIAFTTPGDRLRGQLKTS